MGSFLRKFKPGFQTSFIGEIARGFWRFEVLAFRLRSRVSNCSASTHTDEIRTHCSTWARVVSAFAFSVCVYGVTLVVSRILTF